MPIVFHHIKGFQVGVDALEEGNHEKWLTDELET